MKLLKTVSLASLALLSSVAFSASRSTGGHTVTCKAELVNTAGDHLEEFNAPALNDLGKHFKLHGFQSDDNVDGAAYEVFQTNKAKAVLEKVCQVGLESRLAHLINVESSDYSGTVGDYGFKNVGFFVKFDGQELEVKTK